MQHRAASGLGGTSGPAGTVTLVAALLAWLLGTALQLQQAVLWPQAAVWAVLAGGVAVLACALGALRAVAGRPHPAAAARSTALFELCALCALAVATAAVAFSSTALRAADRVARTLPAALEGQDLLLTGRVAELPRTTAQGTRLVLQVQAAQLLHSGAAVQGVPPQVALGWYQAPGDDAALSGPPQALRAGQRWRLPVRLRQPHGASNPHGFDLELWLLERELHATGTVRVRPQTPAVLLHPGDGLWLQRGRQAVSEAINQQVPDTAIAGVLAALAVGDQAAIERADWDVFRTTGVAHLMSISGLHVTLFAWLVGLVLQRLWRWLPPPALLHLPVPQAARWGGLLAALGYALFSGWGVPAQRTVVMLAVVVGLHGGGLRWPPQLVLLVAAGVVTLADPWALLQPGFWLSFAAVALLVSAQPVQPPGAAAADGLAASDAGGVKKTWLQKLGDTSRTALRTQLVATVGLAPLSMVFFQQLSVVGFVANLVAIPLVTLVVTPLALLGVLVPPLWVAAGAVVQLLMVGLQALAQVPGASYTAAAAPLWAVASGLLAGALALAPVPWRWRVLALPFALPLLVPFVPRPAAGQFELLAADVGQGTAVLVRTQNHLLLYDTGPQFSADTDAGQRLLLPLLRARGERHIDLLMLSHRDTDHVGGAASVLAGLPVRALRSSLEATHPLLAQAAALGVPHTPCTAGQRWVWDGVRFEVLHPQPHMLLAFAGWGGKPAKPNAVSCVLRVQAAGVGGADGANGADGADGAGGADGADGASALLTGDIEAAQEAALVQHSAAALRSTVVLVPHHGSRTSSTPAFIAAVQPQLAVVQAAYRSRFGHPAPDVVARWQGAGVQVLRTDSCGAFSWSSNPAAGGHKPSLCQRQTAQRYWHHGPAAQAVAPQVPPAAAPVP
jgi:competence protein ComEC